MKSWRRGLAAIKLKYKMAKKKIDIKWILLGLIILVLILSFNYISFLERENQLILANINNSITQLQKRISILETKRGECIAVAPASGNRGFLIKDRKLTTSRN